MAFAFRKTTDNLAGMEEGDPPVAATDPSDASPTRNEPMPGEKDVQHAPVEPESSKDGEAPQPPLLVEEPNLSSGDFWARSTEVLVKVRSHLYESTAAQIGLLGLIGAGFLAVWLGFDTPKGHGETKPGLVATTAFPKLAFNGQPPVTPREVHAWLRLPKTTSVGAAISSADDDAGPTRLQDATEPKAFPHAPVLQAELQRRRSPRSRAQSRPRRQRAALFQPGGRLAIASRSGQRDVPEVKVGQRIAAHLMVGVSSAQGGEVLVQVDGLTRGQDVDPFMARGRVHMRSGRLYLDFSTLLQGEDVWTFEGEAVEGRHAGLRARGGRSKASNGTELEDDLLDMGVDALTEPLPSVSLRRLAGRLSQDAQREDRLDEATQSEWEVESGRRFEILVKRPPRRRT